MVNVCTSITWFWLFSLVYVRSTQFYQSLWFSKLQLTEAILLREDKQIGKKKKKRNRRNLCRTEREGNRPWIWVERRKADRGIESTLAWRHIIMKVRKSKEIHWTGAQKAEELGHLCRSLSVEHYSRRQGIKLAWAIQQSPASSTK